MAQLQRVASGGGPTVTLTVDGEALSANEGDTLLVAVLLSGDHLRELEFGGERRAGFCLMGACQDCIVWTEDGRRLRACTTPVREGMRLRRTPGFPAVPDASAVSRG